MDSLKMIILGVPIAKKRPRFVRRGRFVGTYNCQDIEEGKFRWELALRFAGQEPIEGRITLQCRFYMPIPSSISARKREQYLAGQIPHIKKPDLDNLVKFVKDCANGILWRDDSQVDSVVAVKKYGAIPATEIHICWGRHEIQDRHHAGNAVGPSVLDGAMERLPRHGVLADYGKRGC